ncbi:SagB/ThcOx family dehydrogenase [Rhizobium phaseoli]|uniref:SagB/ThcOx family dehydrogenase n=1 Tax=Rhizobium phaseoli TaxID=396 RepID=UPI000F88D790|nr:SagB/ThcOx family dehydrogenase [Rhizobium phaseoli]RUM15809.1 SagB/ThcOx family dehydrogenase [Rhizobium phaseoli]
MRNWKPLLTVRRNLIGGSGEIQISDALSQTRYKVRKRDLLDALAASGERSALVTSSFEQLGLISQNPAHFESEYEGIQHWVSRNWTLAVSYYLWSIRDDFLDKGEDYERLRCDALQEMLNESDLPLPASIPLDEAVHLPKPLPLPSGETCGEVLSKRVTTLVMSSNGQLTAAGFHGLLLHGFSVSRPYHVPDIEDHIHNILHGVGFAFDPYIAVFDVDGIEAGIYYYNISEDRLQVVKRGNFRKEVASGLIGHEQAHTASCTILLTADFSRFQWRYRHERALRNLYFDVGRMAQYLIIIATAYGIKTHITPATVDDALANLLSIDPDGRQVFHTITLGF